MVIIYLSHQLSLYFIVSFKGKIVEHLYLAKEANDVTLRNYMMSKCLSFNKISPLPLKADRQLTT